MSKFLYPKEFIANVLINEIGDILQHHHFLSFILICSGIEFLGKCWDDKLKELDIGRKNNVYFENAIQ